LFRTLAQNSITVDESGPPLPALVESFETLILFYSLAAVLYCTVVWST
jgi:hypothetical protein